MEKKKYTWRFYDSVIYGKFDGKFDEEFDGEFAIGNSLALAAIRAPAMASLAKRVVKAKVMMVMKCILILESDLFEELGSWKAS